MLHLGNTSLSRMNSYQLFKSRESANVSAIWLRPAFARVLIGVSAGPRGEVSGHISEYEQRVAEQRIAR